jgi:hypothetical protein
MTLMLCIKGTTETNTQTGKIYECVGRFICPNCGKVSEILEFAEPVMEFDAINCRGCKLTIPRKARYSHQERFVPLTGVDGLDESDKVDSPLVMDVV